MRKFLSFENVFPHSAHANVLSLTPSIPSKNKTQKLYFKFADILIQKGNV